MTELISFTAYSPRDYNRILKGAELIGLKLTGARAWGYWRSNDGEDVYPGAATILEVGREYFALQLGGAEGGREVRAAPMKGDGGITLAFARQ